jgi:hypothetical protein
MHTEEQLKLLKGTVVVEHAQLRRAQMFNDFSTTI